MNKSNFILLSLLIIGLSACKNENKTPVDPNRPQGMQPGDPASPTVLAGHWIDLDFCSRAGQYGSVLQTMNNTHLPYAYAFSFNPGNPDSVTCYNSNETWNLPVKYKYDTLEVVGASRGKSVFLVYNSHGDKDMTLFDNTSGRTKMDNFIKSKAGAKDGYTAFTTAINHHLFHGEFTPVGKGASGKITFSPGGFVTGMKDLDRYEVCTGGDCFVAGQEIDVITFYNAKQGMEASMKFYGYRYNGGNDTLSLFNLVNARPEDKGGYKVGTQAYKLARYIAPPATSTRKKSEQ